MTISVYKGTFPRKIVFLSSIIFINSPILESEIINYSVLRMQNTNVK